MINHGSVYHGIHMEENDKISDAMLETVEKAYGMLFDVDALQESILGSQL